jgi:hypothetical protein
MVLKVHTDATGVAEPFILLNLDTRWPVHSQVELSQLGAEVFTVHVCFF